jgi:hypothetical protein
MRGNAVFPYRAEIIHIDPAIKGLSIQATSGGRGELEVVNHTSDDVFLIDENGQDFVRITPTEVYELRNGVWVKTKESNTYYWSDARISYMGEGTGTEIDQKGKSWQVTGHVNATVFTVQGRTTKTGK